MQSMSLLESTLRRDRMIVLLALAGVVVLCWAYLLRGAGTLEEMGGMLMPMSSGPWTINHTAIMLVMWGVMMTAMMLPSAAPMILLYATIARGRRAQGATVGHTGVFTLGYVVVWIGFSVLAVTLQFVLERLALLSPMMEATSIALAGLLLLAAGLYQWTPLKQSCLKHCRSPLEFILIHWREGAPGALLMGVRHGSYCTGCCWMLMLLLFVGGVMNFTWIAGLALFVLLEKLIPVGPWIGRAAGVVLVAWGAVVLAGLAGF